MPQYDFWWVDTDIPPLSWSSGSCSSGTTPTTRARTATSRNNPRPPVSECTPNTWHWDNIAISPAVPFTMVRGQQRSASADTPTITLSEPAPPNSQLRFAGIGLDLRVSFDGETAVPAVVQDTLTETKEEHFASFWMDVPPGTTTLTFSGNDWYGGSWHVRDVSAWSPDSPE